METKLEFFKDYPAPKHILRNNYIRDDLLTIHKITEDDWKFMEDVWNDYLDYNDFNDDNHNEINDSISNMLDKWDIRENDFGWIAKHSKELFKSTIEETKKYIPVLDDGTPEIDEFGYAVFEYEYDFENIEFRKLKKKGVNWVVEYEE